MALPPLPLTLLELPDEALGEHLVAWWIGAEAEHVGIDLDAVTEEFATRAVEHAANFNGPGLAAALRLSATGNFKKAGAILREHLRSGAEQILDERNRLKQG